MLYRNDVSEMVQDVTLLSGVTVVTSGYYALNDGGAGRYVISKEGKESLACIKLKNGLYAKLTEENMINVKQLGAKGDGEFDDSIFLYYAFKNYECVYLPKGTFIVNILTACETFDNFRCFCRNPKLAYLKGEGSGSIIKFGNNNFDHTKGTDFLAFLMYAYENIELGSRSGIEFHDFTVDYNIKDNPVNIYEEKDPEKIYEVRYLNRGHEFYYGSGFVKNVRFNNCVFYGHVGSNVLVQTSNTNYIDQDSYFEVKNCKFLDIGEDINGQYTDHSTIYCHLRQYATQGYSKAENINHQMHCIIEHCIFRAVRTATRNAFNAIETGCSTVVQECVIEGYSSGIILCSEYKECACEIYHNQFTNVKEGISIWTTFGQLDTTYVNLDLYYAPYQTYAFGEIKIKDNVYSCNVNLFVNVEDYRGKIDNNIGVFVDMNSAIDRSIRTLSVVNNSIQVETPQVKYIREGRKGCINLVGWNYTGPKESVLPVKIDQVIIKDNSMSGLYELIPFYLCGAEAYELILIKDNIIHQINAPSCPVFWIQRLDKTGDTTGMKQVIISTNNISNSIFSHVLRYENTTGVNVKEIDFLDNEIDCETLTQGYFIPDSFFKYVSKYDFMKIRQTFPIKYDYRYLGRFRSFNYIPYYRDKLELKFDFDNAVYKSFRLTIYLENTESIPDNNFFKGDIAMNVNTPKLSKYVSDVSVVNDISTAIWKILY